MSTYRILFVGDVMGRPGRRALAEALPSLIESYQPLFVIVNGENAAGGVGITCSIADEFWALGTDVITLGNHAFNKPDIIPHLNAGKPIVRPLNMPSKTPGAGTHTIQKDEVKLTVANICGRVFLDGYNDPFEAFDALWPTIDDAHLFIDFHAEATSEKVAFAWHIDGKATAVVGTHTHVQTADERILPEGTAAITDVGMTGPHNGVIGMDRNIVLGKFRSSMPARFEVADGPGVLHGVLIDVDRETGRAKEIERIQFETQS
jgi:2',3'-cyclic-nucleotide 2'-phosphodiesterase